MTGNPSQSGRQRLGDQMNERRLDLGLTWDQVASDAKIHRETLRQIRRGTSELRGLTKRGIERALHWEPGSIDLILAGGSPVPTGETTPVRQETPEQRLDRLYREWKALDPDGLRERLEPGPPGRDIA